MPTQAPDAPCALHLRQRLGRARLAAWWEQARALTLGQHARALWAELGAPSARPHPALLRAFEAGLDHLDDPAAKARALAAFGARAPLQTASHLGASQGPVMFAATRALAAGAPSGVPVLVGAWSALPFDNVAQSGCLHLGPRARLEDWLDPASAAWPQQRRAWANRARDRSGDGARALCLIPAPMRPSPVLAARVPARMLEILSSLREPPRALLGPAPALGAPFAPWALRCCGRAESLALGREVAWFDLCACAARLLGEVLDDPREPAARLLADPRWRQTLAARLPRMALWWTLAPHRSAGCTLRAEPSPARAAARLREGSLWPGLPVAMAAMALYGAGRLVGGVDQWEYARHVWAACEAAQWGASAARDYLYEGMAGGWGVDGVVVGRSADARGEDLPPLEAARWGLKVSPEDDAQAPLLAWFGGQWGRLRLRPSPWGASGDHQAGQHEQADDDQQQQELAPEGVLEGGHGLLDGAHGTSEGVIAERG